MRYYIVKFFRNVYGEEPIFRFFEVYDSWELLPEIQREKTALAEMSKTSFDSWHTIYQEISKKDFYDSIQDEEEG